MLQQSTALWILGVGRKKQHGKGLGAVLGAQQGFVLVQRGAQMHGIQISACNAAFEARLEGPAPLFQFFDIPLYRGVVDAAVEVR